MKVSEESSPRRWREKVLLSGTWRKKSTPMRAAESTKAGSTGSTKRLFGSSRMQVIPKKSYSRTSPREKVIFPVWRGATE